MDKYIIVMTGGTSGFGAITTLHFLKTPGTRVLLGARKKHITGAENIDLDLKSIDGVRSFALEIIRRIDSKKINALVLNAGTNFPNINTRTSDGYETTFAVNHLAHYLLIRLLIPYLADGATIVLTTSGTHDPAEKTMLAPPKHANALWLAHPEQDPTLDKNVQVNAGRAYSSSKLCNILTARYFNTLPKAKANKWKAVTYDPGPTPGTGLLQNGKLIMRVAWKILSVPVLRKRILPKSNSRKSSGTTLANIVLGTTRLPKERIYAALRKEEITFPNPSELAMDDKVMKTLWDDSAALLKI